MTQTPRTEIIPEDEISDRSYLKCETSPPSAEIIALRPDMREAKFWQQQLHHQCLRLSQVAQGQLLD